MTDSILFAVLAGVGIALIAGIIGCFVVWRRMAYLGDSLAHSALLGIALGLVVGISPYPGIAISCSLFAVLLLWLQSKKVLANDTLLGILAHGGLAIGLVVISLLGYNAEHGDEHGDEHNDEHGGEIDLHDFLFGDILTIGGTDVLWIYIGGACALLLMAFNWSSLVLMSIDEDLARAENVHVFFNRLLLMLLMTIVVALATHIVGILLITSLLIIPAATARQWARSPEMMAGLASLLGIVAVLLGIWAAVILGTPAGPSIVTASTLLFALLFPLSTVLAKQ